MHRSSLVPAALIAAALARPLLAQVETGTPSPTPTALREVVVDSAIPRSIRREPEALAAAPPQVIVGSRWRVLVAFAPTVPAFASTARVGELLAACQRELPVGTSGVEFAAQHDPWAEFDSVTTVQPLVVISISKISGPGAVCGEHIVDQAAAAARGIEFLPSAYVADQNPVGAVLRLGGKRIDPMYLGRARVLRIANAVLGRDSSSQLRLYVPLQDLQPDFIGRFPAAELRIVNAARRLEDTVVIPESVLRQVWTQSLPWRIDRLARTAIEDAPLTIPAPNDAIVAKSIASLHGGNRIDAAREAQAGMASPSKETQRYSRVVVGTTLFARGDTLAAKVVLGQAIEADHCLASAAEANALVRAALQPLRSPGDCAMRSASRVFSRGLLFPGLGQSTTGRRGRAIGVGTVALLALSGVAALKSRQDYSSYQAAMTTEDASALFDTARNYRRIATSLVFGGVAVWVGSAAEAGWLQLRHNASVRAVSTYGAQR